MLHKKTEHKEEKKTKTSSSGTESKKSKTLIETVIPDQLRRSERRLGKNDDMHIHPKDLIGRHENLASSSKNLEITENKLLKNGIVKNKALVEQVTFDKNEIVMAKMAGHMIWPAKVIIEYLIC